MLRVNFLPARVNCLEVSPGLLVRLYICEIAPKQLDHEKNRIDFVKGENGGRHHQLLLKKCASGFDEAVHLVYNVRDLVDHDLPWLRLLVTRIQGGYLHEDAGLQGVCN